MLYLSSIPFEEMGLPNLDSEPVTELSEAFAAFGTPSVALSVGSLLGGLYYWFSKKEKNAEAESAIDQVKSEISCKSRGVSS
jgi:hypothetical protein